MASASVEYKLKDVLGRGSYGRVYSVVDVSGKISAAKVIPTTKNGISSLLETSILRIYNHDCLNNSWGIETRDSQTYIAQELADRDLEDEVNLRLPSLDIFKIWTHRIVQGLNCLHSQGIIHCDMKPSNCLIFGEKIKITDFTLSVWKLAADDTFSHGICTLPFRPPEVIMEKKWSNSVDVWSTGCTLYNLFTGKLLIPLQGHKDDPKMSKSKIRQLLKDRTLAAIVKWRQNTGDKAAQLVKIRTDICYTPVVIQERFNELPPVLRDLILSMTSFDPALRPTFRDIMRMEYFKDMTIYHMDINSTRMGKLDDGVSLKIEQVVNRTKRQPHILRLAKEIYGRCLNMPTDNVLPLVKIEACYWIATKLLTGSIPSDTRGELYHIVDMERLICEHLGYRLHLKSQDRLLMSAPTL